MRRDPISQLRTGVIEYCVLALLSAEPRYAGELMDALKQRSDLLESTGTLYPLLARLRRKGLVDSCWVESPNGPPRRYYSLNEPGRAALTEFVGSWREFSATVDAVILGGDERARSELEDVGRVNQGP